MEITARLRAFGAMLAVALPFCCALEAPAMEADTEIRCFDMQRMASPLNDRDGIFAMGLLRGFILGANAADPALLETDIWSRFAQTLHAVCKADPSGSFVDALHRTFETIRGDAP